MRCSAAIRRCTAIQSGRAKKGGKHRERGFVVRSLPAMHHKLKGTLRIDFDVERGTGRNSDNAQLVGSAQEEFRGIDHLKGSLTVKGSSGSGV